MKRLAIGLMLILAVSLITPVTGSYSAEKDVPGNDQKNVESGRKLEFENIVVKSTRENGFVERKHNETATQSTVTKEAISLSGGPGQSSYFKALDLLPSINVESADPYGFSASPTSIRVRGQQAIGMSTMVGGVPVWGIQSPGPRQDMFDLENFQSITLYRGGVPPDKGLGGMDTAGALDIEILKPTDTFGMRVHQGAGSYGFLRSFVRLDSGKLPTDTKFFISGSHTTANKWKGDGGAPAYRDHVSFGIEQPVSSRVKTELYFDYNVEKMYSYRGLTYAQTKDLSQYRNLDYNPVITGRAAADGNYYGFNWNKAENYNLIGAISIEPTATTLITFRPYYWSENKPAWSGKNPIPGTATPGISKWENNFDRVGGVLEYKTLLAGTNVKIGYWFESFNFPITETYYGLQNGSLVYNRTLFAEPDGRGLINSPYLRVTRDFGKDLHVDLGLRYLCLQAPGVTGRLSTSSATDPDNNYHGITNREWLPYAGVSYSLTPNASIYTSYGRNYAYPHGWPNVFSNYIAAKAAYTAAGVNMQYLVDNVKLVTSDNYELGLRFNGKRFYVTPALFYADYRNKLFSVYDPTVAQTIRQSIGKSRVYGTELEVGVTPIDNLSIYGSFSYNKSEITEDFKTATNTVIAAKGKQTPDTPEILAKLAVTYNLFGVEISPIAKFVDSRFGDVLNSERIPSYWVFDLDLKYSLPPFLGLKDVTLGINVQNLFDRSYIGAISSFDDTAKGSYMVGAPRTIVGSVAARF